MLNQLLIIFSTVLCTMMKDIIKNIHCKLVDVTETVLIKTFLFGNCSVDAQTNTQILNTPIKYILTTERFDEFVSFLRRKTFGLCFLYIITRICLLIEDKSESVTGCFVASSFTYYD